MVNTKTQSKSARIRKMLAQGKSVKQITSVLGVTAQFVYTIRSQERKKSESAMVKKWKSAKPQEWVMVGTSTSAKPIGIPKDVYDDHVPPRDYYQPKRNVVQRFFNWLCGG